MSDAEPVPKWLIGVLEDRSGDVRKPIAGLWSAIVTLPTPRMALQLVDFRATPGTANVFRPTATDEISAASIFVGEHRLELSGGKLLDRLGSEGHRNG